MGYRKGIRTSRRRHIGGNDASKDEALQAKITEKEMAALRRQYQEGGMSSDTYRREAEHIQRTGVAEMTDASMHIDSLLALFARVNSVIAGKDISCHTDSSGISGGVACTDGKNVYFSVDKLLEWFKVLRNSRYNPKAYSNALRSIMDFRGINYHELAHILFTPNGAVFHEALFGYSTNYYGTQPTDSMFWPIKPTKVRCWEQQVRTETNERGEREAVSVMGSADYDCHAVPIAKWLAVVPMLALYERTSRGMLVANAKFAPSLTKVLSDKKKPFWLTKHQVTGGVDALQAGLEAFMRNASQKTPPQVLNNNGLFDIPFGGYGTDSQTRSVRWSPMHDAFVKYERHWQSCRDMLSPRIRQIVKELDSQPVFDALSLDSEGKMQSWKMIATVTSTEYEDQHPHAFRHDGSRFFHSYRFTGDDCKRAWNLLEDMRIESLMVARYAPVRHYFAAAVLQHLIKAVENAMKNRGTKSPDEVKAVQAQLWLFVYGRRYLPQSLIQEARTVFQNQFKATDGQMKELELIIDTYRRAPISKDKVWLEANKGNIALLVMRFLEIVDMELGVPFIDDSNTFQYDTHDNQNGGSAPTTSDIEEMVEKVRANDESADEQEDGQEDESKSGDSSAGEQEDEDADDGADDGDEDGDEDGADDGADDGDDDGDDDTEKAAPPSPEGDKDSNHANISGSTDTPGIDASKTGTKFGSNPDANAILRTARKILDATTETLIEQAQETMTTVAKRVEKIREENLFRDPVDAKATIPVGTDWRLMSVSLRGALRQLQSYRENDWNRGTDNGTVNIGAFIDSRGLHTDFFDEWVDDGDERADCEIIILMDSSGSMGGNMEQACSATWAIKNACQDTGIPCSVFMYDTTYQLVCGPHDRVAKNEVPLFSEGGGTEPQALLNIVGSYLTHVSDAKHKILFSVTDGAWGGGDYAGVLGGMNQAGVETILLQLPRYSLAYIQARGDSMDFKDAFSMLPEGNYGHSRHIRCAGIMELGKSISHILVEGVKNR